MNIRKIPISFAWVVDERNAKSYVERPYGASAIEGILGAATGR